MGTRLAARALAPLLAMAAAAPAAARPGWISGTYVYADLCVPAEGGLAGHRITLRRSPKGDGLVYEAAPGGAGTALGPEEIHLDDARRTLAFDAETEGGPVAFDGIATPEALTGTLRDAGGDHAVVLPRMLRAHAPRSCAGDVTGTVAPAR